jgi:ABC-type antimicrobial peptide transport system permease subunit
MRRANPEVALHDVMTMEQRFDGALWAKRASSWLTATFSAVALLLAVGGIYGVIAHGIRRRRNELCIRMALGASTTRVIRQVLTQGLTVIGAGIAAGLVVARVLARTLSSLVATITPTDPVVYVGVTVLLLLAAVAAIFLPARRLAKLEPAGALRGD